MNTIKQKRNRKRTAPPLILLDEKTICLPDVSSFVISTTDAPVGLLPCKPIENEVEDVGDEELSLPYVVEEDSIGVIQPDLPIHNVEETSDPDTRRKKRYRLTADQEIKIENLLIKGILTVAEVHNAKTQLDTPDLQLLANGLFGDDG